MLFDAFQNSVGEDASKKEIADGTVHPLTASVLTFFKRLFKHSNFMKVLYGSAADSAKSSQFQIGNHMSGTMVRILMILQVYISTITALSRSPLGQFGREITRVQVQGIGQFLHDEQPQLHGDLS